MQKKIFYYKKKYYSIKTIMIIILLITISVFIFITQPNNYFIIDENQKKFYLIPKDREGEKVKHLNKKSINNSYIKNTSEVLNNIDSLNYTIQIYSNSNFKNVEMYFDKYLKSRKEILDLDQVYIFNIVTELGKIYFLTYKNFIDYETALSNCKKLSFINKCLVLNLKNE